MKHIIAFLLLFVPAALFAGDDQLGQLPALYDVYGVAMDDTLNVRTGPTASADKIGTLDPVQRDIEILAFSPDGKWGMLNLGERTGWASLRFLFRQTGQHYDVLPQPLRCYGTEPFWALSLDHTDNALFSVAGEIEEPYNILSVTSSRNRTDAFGVFSTGNYGMLVGTVKTAICDDGMSDRSFGLSIEIITKKAFSTAQYSGCCTLAP